MSDLVDPTLAMSDGFIRTGLAVVVLCVLIAVAFYVVASCRDYVAGDQEVTSDVLANLQEMHLKGDITDEEFRTIQARTQQHRLHQDDREDVSIRKVADGDSTETNGTDSQGSSPT